MDEGLQTTALELSDATLDFLAGGAGGCAGVLTGAPLDIVRIRQQQRQLGGGPLPSAAQLLRSIVAAEGVQSLWKGMAYPLATAALQAYGAASRYLLGRSDFAAAGDAAAPGARTPLPIATVFWAGCCAGVVQTVVTTPVDLLKIRMQLQTAVPGMPGYVGPLALLQRVVRTEGLRALWRGLPITMIRDWPSHGVYFASFELCREMLEPGSRSGSNASAMAVWAAGGMAGALSWLSIYPFDLIKSRIQATSAADSRYKGWVDCAVQSYRQEGAGVFSRGLNTTLSRAFLTNGAIFTAYELCHKSLSE